SLHDALPIWDRFPRQGIERWHHIARSTLVLPPELQLNPAVDSTKQDRRLQLRVTPVLRLPQCMTGDEQFVGLAFPQHVHAHKGLGDHYGMYAVESNRLDRMQTLKRAAILTRKRHIPAKLAHRSA